MPLFENANRRVLFIHVPKTGGTAVVNLLRRLCRVSFYAIPRPSSMRVSPQHMPIGDIRAMMSDDSWEYGCALVRDPYARLESEFRYRVANLEKRFGHEPDFSTWVLHQIEAVSRDSCHLDNHMRRQTDFLDEDVEVFKYEGGTGRCTEKILCHLGLDSTESSPPIVNVGEQRELSWSMPARLACNRYYESDFSILGYTLIEPSVSIEP